MKTVLNVVLEQQKMKTTKKHLKIFIIAGEVSGDVLGAKIMHAMPGVDFVGIGGDNMAKKGLKTIFPISDLAVMGIFEVLGHAKTLTRRIKQTVDAIIKERPDIVLTIDSPGFAKAVVSKVRKLIKPKQIKFFHVVAPQVWAWRPKRAKKYAKIFDKLYAFFEFEIPYFTRYGLKTVAVGHPIADGIDKYIQTKDIKEKIITFVPGSRMSEVKKLLPVFQKTIDLLKASGYENYRFVIPTVETTDTYIRNNIKNWNIKPDILSADKRYELYATSYIAIVASGTVSAELAMMHIPTIVVYKMNPLTVMLAHILLKVKWASLVNILMNKTIYPELLGKHANPIEILNVVQQLTLPGVRRKMVDELKKADKKWQPNKTNAAMAIAKDIFNS